MTVKHQPHIVICVSLTLSFSPRAVCCSPVEVSSQGSHVGPGKTFTYTWQVKDGPSPSDPSCIPYLYFSAADPVADTNSGLMGPLLVCKKGSLAESGSQVLLLSVTCGISQQGCWSAQMSMVNHDAIVSPPSLQL